MKTLQINTTQNVNINFELANVGQRLAAFIIDNVIKFAYIYMMISFFKFSVFNEAVGGDYWSLRAIDVLVLLPLTFYSLYLEILMNGQTIGKKLLKIRVINIDGFKPSAVDFTMRWFLRIVDFNLFILVFVYLSSLNLMNNVGLIYAVLLLGKFVGFVSILLTKNNQRIGDIPANTIIVSLRDKTMFSHTILENISEDYVPTYPNVIKLSDNDARIIKETFKVAASTNNHKTLLKLKIKIEDVTGIKAKENSAKDFIDTILKDYNYYTQNM